MVKKKEEKANIIDIQKLLEITQKSYPDALISLASSPDLKISTIPSGIWMLDTALKGGFRRGSLNEICGEFSTGKTWIVYNTIKQAQSLGLSTALIDTEKRIDPEWAKDKIGINLESLLYARTAVAEDAFGILYEWLDKGIDLIGIDSFASFVPRQLIKERNFNPTIGVKAKIITEGLEKLVGMNHNSVVLVTNQLRASIGDRYHPGLLSKMTGGSRQYYDAASIIEVRRRGWIKDKESEEAKKIGFIMECIITKVNYASTVQTSVKVPYNFKTGQIDNVAALVELAIDREIIKHGGPWYEYEGDKIQGQQGIYDYFRNDEKRLEELRTRVLL